MYRSQIDLQIPKSLAMEFGKDPFIIAGIFGHVAILSVKDKIKGEFVTPDDLQQPANEFRVAYVYGVPPNYKVYPGIFKGPEIAGDEIKYSGYTEDGKVSFTLSFIFKSLGSITRLYITTNFEYRGSFLDKLIGRSSFDLAKHIVEGHYIPYIKFYFNYHVPKEMELTKKVVLEEEGDMSMIIEKFKEVIKSLQYGVVEITSEGLECTFVIVNGNVKKGVCKGGNEIKTDAEALSSLLFVSGKGKITVYEVNLEDYFASAH